MPDTVDALFAVVDAKAHSVAIDYHEARIPRATAVDRLEQHALSLSVGQPLRNHQLRQRAIEKFDAHVTRLNALHNRSNPWEVLQDNKQFFGIEFINWLPHNIHVWIEFERHAMMVIRRGRTHYSSKTIVHVMRHESAIRENGKDGYKLNNNHARPLARLFALMHPEHADLFEFREPALPEIDICAQT